MIMEFAVLLIVVSPVSSPGAPHYQSVATQLVEFQTEELCKAGKAILVKTDFTHATDCFRIRGK